MTTGTLPQTVSVTEIATPSESATVEAGPPRPRPRQTTVVVSPSERAYQLDRVLTEPNLRMVQTILLSPLPCRPHPSPVLVPIPPQNLSYLPCLSKI